MCIRDRASSACAIGGICAVCSTSGASAPLSALLRAARPVLRAPLTPLAPATSSAPSAPSPGPSSRSLTWSLGSEAGADREDLRRLLAVGLPPRIAHPSEKPRRKESVT